MLPRKMTPHKKIGKERVHRKELFKSVSPQNAIRGAPNYKERTQEEASQQERWTRGRSMGFVENVLQGLKKQGHGFDENSW